MRGAQGGALNRNHVNHYIWKPALRAAEVEPTRENGMHALRHHYASVLLDAGESIKAVSEYFGQADAGFTPADLHPPHAVELRADLQSGERCFRVLRGCYIGSNSGRRLGL